jgi:DNA primase large subunit
LHGFQEKLGDLSWLGPSYADKGWVELTQEEQEALKAAAVTAKVQALKAETQERLDNSKITVGEKIALNEYLLALDSVCLRPDFGCDPKFPVKL